jgi:hypothetical protein
MIDRIAAQRLYFKIVFGALGLFTYALVASILSFRPATEPKDIITSMVRLPAAIPAALPSIAVPVNLPMFNQAVKVAEPIKIETLALSCWDVSQAQAQVQSTSARWIRLVGRACAETLDNNSWEVSNKSNGFSATVFTPGQKQLTTDYIPLAPGKNEIRMAVLDADGVSHEVTFNVERQ